MQNELKSLIKDTSENSIPLSVLLRRTKVIAVGAKLDNLIAWVNLELNGYADKIPDYRSVEGYLQGLNRLTGWERVTFEDPKEAETFSHHKLKQPVAELEDLLLNKETANYLVRHTPEQNTILGEIMKVNTEFSLALQRSQIKGVIEKIRGVLLDYLLELKKTTVEEPAEVPKIPAAGVSRVVQEFHIGSIEKFEEAIGTVNQNTGTQEQEIILPQEKEGFIAKFFWQLIAVVGAVIAGILVNALT